MSLCCELLKVMYSKDKVQLTGMHDRQGLVQQQIQAHAQICIGFQRAQGNILINWETQLSDKSQFTYLII